MKVVLYPWHPFHLKRVRVSPHGKHVKDGLLNCRLDENPDEILEIPAWMLDPAQAVLWTVTSIPVVSMCALLDLRHLLGAVSSANSVESITDGHSPLKENVHEKAKESAPEATVPLRPADADFPLGGSAAPAESPGCPFAGGIVAEVCPRPSAQRGD